MKHIKITILIVLLIAAIGCGKDPVKKETPVVTQTQTPKPPAADPNDAKPILQINTEKYTNGDLKTFIRAQYSGLADGNPNPRIISRLFDSFVEHKIATYVARQYNIPVSDTEYQQHIEKIKNSDPDKKLDKSVVIDSIRVQKYLYQVVYNGIDVSKKEIRDHYNKNVDEYRKKAEVMLHQILVKNKDEAVRIRSILNNYPGRFEELARQYSISMEKDKGGLMGYFEEGTLPKDMEKVVFSLNVNAISPVVDSIYGFHIFKVTRKKTARLLYLKAVEGEIKNQLMAEKLRLAYENFIENARKDLNVVTILNNLYVKYHSAEGPENQYSEGEVNNYETSNSTDNNTDNINR